MLVESSLRGSPGSQEVRRGAQYILCDLVEKCSLEALRPHLAKIHATTLANLASSEATILQAAAFGLGALALKFPPQSFGELAEPGWQALLGALKQVGFLEELPGKHVRDNVASALIKLFREHKLTQRNDKGLRKIAELVPLRHDKAEALVAHAILFELLAAPKEGELLRAHKDLQKKLLAAAVSVLQDAECSNASIDESIRKLLAEQKPHMQQAKTWDDFYGALSASDKAKLQ